MAVTDLADTAAATTAGYANSSYVVTSQGQLMTVAKYSKYIRPTRGQAIEFAGLGVAPGGDAAAQTAALAKALTSLNAIRRHRYGGAPGQPSGATSTWDQQDTSQTPFTTDVN